MKTKRERILKNPVVSLPPVTRAISKPTFCPKKMRKTVAAVHMVNPTMVKPVWSFLRIKSFTGNAISLICGNDPTVS